MGSSEGFLSPQMGEITAFLYAVRNELEEWKIGDTGKETLHSSELSLRLIAISWNETSQLVWVCCSVHCQVFMCSWRVAGIGFSRSWSFTRHVWQRDIERTRRCTWKRDYNEESWMQGVMKGHWWVWHSKKDVTKGLKELADSSLLLKRMDTPTTACRNKPSMSIWSLLDTENSIHCSLEELVFGIHLYLIKRILFSHCEVFL